ncbi:AMP-binding protein [Verticiella sediminum]|uniref:AMP-binding protein n=1 Tax=Verticiella sediminum TaxID=1247510 RepID=A0A556AXE2_9BURK|nr:AMP-binding protein [Verticiella sediminum]TSH97609.1 AMP-binding protein [Verticiella sediminum]
MPADVLVADRPLAGSALAQRAERLAGGWRALGLREGDVVAVLLRNSIEFLETILACRQAGCYYCPLNWHLTTAEIAYILEDSGARLLIAGDTLLGPVRAAVPDGVPVLVVGDAAAHAGATAYEPWLAQQRPYDGPVVAPRAHMAYTSGTTGRPKGVVRLPVPLEQAAARTKATQRIAEIAFGLRPGCRALMTAPIYHSGPSAFAQTALQNAELLALMPRFDAEDFLRLVQELRIDTTYLVPIMYVRLLQLPQDVRRRYDVSSLRFIGSTGAPCAPEVKRAMIDWFGPVIHETYGSSEGGMITLATSEHALTRPGTAGLPIDGAVIRILDDGQRPVPAGEIGRIFFRQPAYPDFTYRNRPQARAEIEHEGLVCLGDMGYLDEDGFLFLCDRASNMVISGGVNIYPAEIEHQLLQYPGVGDCVVFGIPDAEYGERLLGMVQPQPGARLDSASIIDWLSQRLARFKIPRIIEIRDALPRDENGKIAKRHLREPYWQGQTRRI